MIVKTIRIKTKDFARLANYIEDDKGRSQDNSPFDKNFRVFHNVQTPSVEGAIAALKANDKYRKVRKGGVVLYHEVLSFSPKSKAHITQTIVEDLAYKYIRIRAENGVCFAKPHVHEKHIHVHFLFSGVELESNRTLRMDNSKFKEIRLEIERHQLQKYPELKHSIVYLNKEKQKEKSNVKGKEFQAQKRLKKEGKISQKERVHQLLQEAISKSDTLDDFYQNIEQQGLKIYSRGKNKKTGIVLETGKKYRFSTVLKHQWTNFQEQSKTYSERMKRIKAARNREEQREQEIENSREQRLREARSRGRDDFGRTI